MTLECLVIVIICSLALFALHAAVRYAVENPDRYYIVEVIENDDSVIEEVYIL